MKKLKKATNLSIHDALIDRNKSINWPYLGSIIIVNKNVPLFESKFGWLDYDWLVKITGQYESKEIEPCVIRSLGKSNLSLDPEYRKNDFEEALKFVSSIGKKRLHGSYARYFYKIGNYRNARKYLLKSELTLKNVMYYLTSFFPFIARFISKTFRIFG